MPYGLELLPCGLAEVAIETSQPQVQTCPSTQAMALSSFPVAGLRWE